VIEAPDVEHTIYEVPLLFAEQNLDNVVIDALGIRAGRRNLKPWRDYVDRVIGAEHEVNIGLVGKYTQLPDAYKSIREALNHGGAFHAATVNVHSVNSEDIEQRGAQELLKSMHGILIPGGFGTRGHEGKIAAVKWAREKRVPFLGICLGLQMAVVEFARDVLGLKDADSEELRAETGNPVIHLMAEQKQIMNLGGTMRLGAFPCKLKKGSIARKIYGKDQISERHRHRYEFNNAYRERFEQAGMELSGVSPDGMLVEMIEIKEHPFFVAGQFHPEFKSRPVEPHPLFRDFIGAAVKLAGKKK
jgi:CTP synthase